MEKRIVRFGEERAFEYANRELAGYSWVFQWGSGNRGVHMVEYFWGMEFWSLECGVGWGRY
jgi:hypothetical protein